MEKRQLFRRFGAFGLVAGSAMPFDDALFPGWSVPGRTRIPLSPSRTANAVSAEARVSTDAVPLRTRCDSTRFRMSA